MRQLTLVDCEFQPGFQLTSLMPQLPGLFLLRISHAADLDAVCQHLKRLLFLSLRRAPKDVTSLAALAFLTPLNSLSLQHCSHLSSIAPLTALTGLESLRILSCPHLTSLTLLTALNSLRQLRLEGCPQLEASLPASLQPLLEATPGGEDILHLL
jgi:hypothetical protein